MGVILCNILRRSQVGQLDLRAMARTHTAAGAHSGWFEARSASESSAAAAAAAATGHGGGRMTRWRGAHISNP